MEQQKAPVVTATYAWQLLRLRRPEMALQVAARLLALDPTDLRPHLVRTEAFRQLLRLPEAAAAAKDAITVAPQSATAFAAFAQVRGQQGELAKAEKLIEEALRLSPVTPSYHSFFAQLQYLQKRPSEALATATAGLRIDAQHADCLLWRAIAQEALDQPAQADADFARVLHMAPCSGLVHEWRGRLLLQRYEPHAAAPHLAEALRLTPDNTTVLLLLRRARRQQLWPGWLLQQRQQQLQDQLDGRLFDWRGLVAGTFTPFYTSCSWWRTRKQPLFQQKIPGLRRAMLRKWLTLLTLIVVPLAMLYAFIVFELPPYTLVILVVALIRGLMTQKE